MSLQNERLSGIVDDGVRSNIYAGLGNPERPLIGKVDFVFPTIPLAYPAHFPSLLVFIVEVTTGLLRQVHTSDVTSSNRQAFLMRDGVEILDRHAVA